MLGTLDEAEDIVQEAWLRWSGADRAAIDNAAAWLTTVTSRLAIDRLGAAERQRERYVGPWLPEPVTTADLDPAELAASADTLTLGFLRVLGTLTPVERLVFLLREVFDHPFAEVAAIVGRSPDATRQIAHRARRRVRDGRARVDVDVAEASHLTGAFLAAIIDGDVDRLTSMLTADVILVNDGGEERRAARHPIIGPGRVARFLVTTARRAHDDGATVREVEANGQRGHLVETGGQPVALVLSSWRDGAVAEVLLVSAPSKLARLAGSG